MESSSTDHGFLLHDIIVQNLSVKTMLDNGRMSSDDIVNLMLVSRASNNVFGKQLKKYMRNMYIEHHPEFLQYIANAYNLEESFLHPFKFSNYLKAIDFVRNKTKGTRWRHLFKDVLDSSIFVNLGTCNKELVNEYVINTMRILLVVGDYIRDKICAHGNMVNGIPLLVWHVYLLFDFVRLNFKYNKNSTILNHKTMVETLQNKINEFYGYERYIRSAGLEVGYRTMRLLESIDRYLDTC